MCLQSYLDAMKKTYNNQQKNHRDNTGTFQVFVMHKYINFKNIFKNAN